MALGIIYMSYEYPPPPARNQPGNTDNSAIYPVTARSPQILLHNQQNQQKPAKKGAPTSGLMHTHYYCYYDDVRLLVKKM